MGLLSDIFSYGDGLKRQVSGLLSDPVGTAALGVQRAGDQWNGLLNTMQTAYPMSGQNSVLVSPQQRAAAQAQVADQGAQMGMAGIVSPLTAKTLLPMDEAARAERMQQMGLERGWFRGGEAPVNGKRTGPMYTQDATEATGYASGRGGDVREYAIPQNNMLMADRSYDERLPHAIADVLDTPYYGPTGARLAGEFRNFKEGDRIAGQDLWQILKSNFGSHDDAAEIVQKLGPFLGAKGVTKPGEAYVFKQGAVRDANQAVFDPANRAPDALNGSATIPMMGLLGAGSLGLAGLLHKGQP
jgi:hypothetical protein